MSGYKAPLRDIQFVLNELLECQKHYAGVPGGEELNDELLGAILAEAAKFSEEVLSPLNQSGDAEGCHWSEEGVTTPAGFKEAYQQFVEGGWPGIAGPLEYGGQGLPDSLDCVLNDMVGASNWAWSMYSGLTQGAVRCLLEHGSDTLKEQFLGRLVDGTWAGTMCLTEAHCGSDLGLLRTKASPTEDGSYSITGSKIFISGGDQDLTENIIHLVLARIDGAPDGTSGISLFLVPKKLPDAEGNPGDANGVSCGSIEHKMGINGSATCVMNFDGATGYLIGEENRGLACMFTMMNAARIATAMQGVAIAERSYQGAVDYAVERLQMRSLSGPKNPEGPADPIIVHPDVRRMLLTQKAFIEAGRALIYWLGLQIDIAEAEGEGAEQAEQLLSLLTPVAKAFATETGFESVNLGLQVFGGHGYVREWGMEQNVRDMRIAMVYEGTTGIQALDLLGRKVMGSQGESLRLFTKQIHLFCKEHKESGQFLEFIEPLDSLNRELGEATMALAQKAMANHDEVGAASVDYLMYFGYIVYAYFWAQMAIVASKAIEGGSTEAIYPSKVSTARFYFERVLPRTRGHHAAMLNGGETMMAPEVEEFLR